MRRRRVIAANGGQLDGNTAGEDRFWITSPTNPNAAEEL
jgi:predicted acetyltransferase